MPALLPRLLLLGLLVGLAACSTDATLSYTPPATLLAGQAPVVGAVTATDQRRESPNRLATIMGGFGNPLKIRNTQRPVKDEVVEVFTQALRARGLLGAEGTAPFRIALTIRKFDADQIMGRGTRIDLDLVLLNAAGQPVYRDTVADERSEMQFFATGVFASIDELQEMAQKLLDATVDRMLDKPEFRAALAQVAG